MPRHLVLRKGHRLRAADPTGEIIVGIVPVVTDDEFASQIWCVSTAVAQRPTIGDISRRTAPHDDTALRNRSVTGKGTGCPGRDVAVHGEARRRDGGRVHRAPHGKCALQRCLTLHNKIAARRRRIRRMDRVRHGEQRLARRDLAGRMIDRQPDVERLARVPGEDLLKAKAGDDPASRRIRDRDVEKSVLIEQHAVGAAPERCLCRRTVVNAELDRPVLVLGDSAAHLFDDTLIGECGERRRCHECRACRHRENHYRHQFLHCRFPFICRLPFSTGSFIHRE